MDRQPPSRTVTELGLLGVDPPSGGDLVFTATQAFADGTKIEWSGAADSKTPAPHVRLVRGSR